jgi:hypothetical protein
MKSPIKIIIFFATMFNFIFTADVFAQQAPVAKTIVKRIIDERLTVGPCE